jgi:hypothetical protein
MNAPAVLSSEMFQCAAVAQAEEKTPGNIENLIVDPEFIAAVVEADEIHYHMEAYAQESLFKDPEVVVGDSLSETTDSTKSK